MHSETAKYRPAFTAPEIAYLIDICNLDHRPATAEMAFAIASRLKVFLLKAQLGVTGSAFTSSPKLSLEEKLGMESNTPAERRFIAYQKWSTNPAICTPQELMLAHTYRYENGMMSPQEEIKYEQAPTTTEPPSAT